MVNTAALIGLNGQRWKAARPTRNFSTVARRLVAGKPRYQSVCVKTGVPWFVIAVIHEREASGSWTTQLGQGDPLDSVSHHVPKGRGPFRTWEDGAYDALVLCPPYAYSWTNWSAGGALTLLEEYNGLGYAQRGIPSPYVWSGTNQYVKGKYVKDGVFDANEVDEQLGCAGLIMAMREFDSTIKFSDEGLAPSHPPPPTPPPAAAKPVLRPPQQPASGGFFVALLNLLNKIFWGKR